MAAIQTIRNTANTFDELADLIANPPADRPIAGAIGNGGRRLCDAYGNLGLGAQLLTGPGRPILNLLCEPYFDQGGYDPPTDDIPFSGGQCEGVDYVVGTLGSSTCPSGPTDVAAFTSGPGPISSITGVTTPTGNFPVAWTTTWTVQFSDNSRTFTVNHVAQDEPCFRVFTSSGAPDDCGDPPGELAPGENPPPDPGPFPAGQEPGINPIGQPFFFIPDIEQPGLEPFPIDDEPLGGAPPAPALPTGGDGLPGNPEAIGDEAGEVNGGDDGEEIDFGEPPEGKVWVGCIVETSTDSRIGNISGTGPQSTVWPSVRGNVALRYGSKFGKSERINSRFHDIFRPNTSLTVTGCFLQMQPGSTGTVFPISAITCPEDPCGE